MREEIHRRRLGRDPDAHFSFNGSIVGPGDGIAPSWVGVCRGSLETLAEGPPAPAWTLCGMCGLWSEVPWASRMAGLRSGGGRSGAQVEGELRALCGRVIKGESLSPPTDVSA